MKPKENRGNKVGTYDNCQTPPYALEPLLPYLPKDKIIWECAAGKRILSTFLKNKGFWVLDTDINDVFYGDFFRIGNVTDNTYTIVTNPPYSIKYDWLDRCFELGRPFALLLPVEALGAKRAQKYIDQLDIMLLQPRVDFYMPDKGYEGGGAQFPTAWFTHELLPYKLEVECLNKPKRNELAKYWKEALGE